MAEDEREPDQERPFTDALPPFAEMVTGVAEMEPEEMSDDAVVIHQIRVSFPVELEVEQDDAGHLQVRGAPPLLRTRTGFMPVYHQMSLRIVKEASRGN
jgi:hypothetical protein